MKGGGSLPRTPLLYEECWLVDHFEQWAKILPDPPRDGEGQLHVDTSTIDDVDVPSFSDVKDFDRRYRNLFHRAALWMLANCSEDLCRQLVTRDRNLVHHRRFLQRHMTD